MNERNSLRNKRNMGNQSQDHSLSPTEQPDKIQNLTTAIAEERYDEHEIKLDREKQEARQRFAVLIQAVSERYRSPDSFLTGENLENFEIHNNEMLDMCIERGMEKGLTDQELRMLEVAAILHDIAKADLNTVAAEKLGLPAEAGAIPVLAFIAHHELAAQEVRPLLKQHPELIDHILGPEHSPEQVDDAIRRIETAIRAHMGPHNPPGKNEPGYFMDGILAFGNGELRKLGIEGQIEHPYPEPGDAIAETLLAADMRSLAGIEGRKKVMGLRLQDARFQAEDAATVSEYGKYGIELTKGEAALLSAFNSAFCARDMLPSQEDQDWVDELIELSKAVPYNYGEEEVRWQSIRDKQARYKDALALAQHESF